MRRRPFSFVSARRGDRHAAHGGTVFPTCRFLGPIDIQVQPVDLLLRHPDMFGTSPSNMDDDLPGITWAPAKAGAHDPYRPDGDKRRRVLGATAPLGNARGSSTFPGGGRGTVARGLRRRCVGYNLLHCN